MCATNEVDHPCYPDGEPILESCSWRIVIPCDEDKMCTEASTKAPVLVTEAPVEVDPTRTPSSSPTTVKPTSTPSAVPTTAKPTGTPSSSPTTGKPTSTPS